MPKIGAAAVVQPHRQDGECEKVAAYKHRGIFTGLQELVSVVQDPLTRACYESGTRAESRIRVIRQRNAKLPTSLLKEKKQSNKDSRLDNRNILEPSRLALVLLSTNHMKIRNLLITRRKLRCIQGSSHLWSQPRKEPGNQSRNHNHLLKSKLWFPL